MTPSTQVIARTVPELVSWLQEICNERVGTEPPIDSRLFVLIDQAKLPDWTTHEQKLTGHGVFKSEAVNLYDDLPGLMTMGPLLAEVEQSEEALLALAEFAINQEAASFLLGDSDPAYHLREIREVAMPDGTGALFRYQDIHFISAMWPLMTSGQTHRLLGPAKVWAVRDVCGEMLSLVNRRVDRLKGPIQFTKHNVAALDEAMLPWKIVAQVREIDSSLLEGLNGCACRTLIQEKIKLARRQGLKLRPDISLYCILSLQLPEGFEKEPPFAAALEKVRAGYSGFVSAIDRVTSDEWLVASQDN